VGLVTIKAPAWRVAESRRVCSRHHTELGPQAPQEASVGKNELVATEARQMQEVTQALRALLAEVDPFQAPLVADLAPLQVVAALRKAHMDTVARWSDKAERLTEERAAEFRQLTSQQEALVGTVKELRAQSGDGGAALQSDVDVALDLLRWAATTVTHMGTRKDRVVASLVASAILALKGKA
jgi:ABC-type transporter Mla subunit MlaD